MAESPEDMNIVESLRNLVQKNLEIDLACLGMIYHDKSVHQSLCALKPLVLQSPDALATKQIQRTADKIAQSRNFPDMPLDLSMYKDSFELTDIEARYDFSEKDPAGKAGTDTAGLGPEEFLAVMTAQQKKINELQGTIRMLTMKNTPQF
jgi:flagellar biosynthesis protein FlhG